MPPKVKYTREQFLNVALDMTRNEGIESVTARELGARMGISSRPIFTAFENMDEVHREVVAAAKTIFRQYVDDFNNYTPAFKRFGMQMIKFAIDEPKLFQLLFTKETTPGNSLKDAISELYDNPDQVVAVIIRDYELSEELAWKLFQNMMVFSYGIGLLCSRRVCSFTQEELEVMIGEEFAGLVSLYRSGQYRYCGVKPSEEGTLLHGRDVKDIPYRYIRGRTALGVGLSSERE